MNGGAYFSPKFGALGSNSFWVSSRMKPMPWAAIGTSVKRKKSAAALEPASMRTSFLSHRGGPRIAGGPREERPPARRVQGQVLGTVVPVAHARRRHQGRRRRLVAVAEVDVLVLGLVDLVARRGNHLDHVVADGHGADRADHQRSCTSSRPGRLPVPSVTSADRVEGVAAVEHARPHLVEVAQAVVAVRWGTVLTPSGENTNGPLRRRPTCSRWGSTRPSCR